MTVSTYFLFVFASIFTLAIQAPPSPSSNQETCKEAARRIADSTNRMYPPEGTWTVYRTNDLEFACTTFTYTTVKNVNGVHEANGVFRLRRDPDMKVEYLITVAQIDPNQYVAMRHTDGVVTRYHRLNPEVRTLHRHYWCAFSCESDGVFVKSVVCFIDNVVVMPIVDQLIENLNLPLRPSFYMFNVYEDCGTVDPTSEL